MLVLALILPFLLSLVAAEVPLRFNDARDFYHELDEASIRFMLQKMSLNPKTAEILGRLVADDAHNIQYHYEMGCSLMSKGRASTILHLVEGRKDLEMLLLGTACLSEDIITVRKKFLHMWPPRGFPLLSINFQPKIISTMHIKDILQEALNQPEWWQSPEWVAHVHWHRMEDLSFWRMIPPRFYSNAPNLYIRKVSLEIKNQPTFQDLEELLMKSIRMKHFDDGWRRALKEKKVEGNGLSYSFSHLQDSWSISVLGLLKKMHSAEWTCGNLRKDLLQSKLLQLASWTSGPIDSVTSTNDIFELFTVAFEDSSLSGKEEALRRSFVSFLDEIVDWSAVRPSVLHSVLKFTGDFSISPFQKYLGSMLTSSNTHIVLRAMQNGSSAPLQVHKYSAKLHSRSLKDQFQIKDSANHYRLSPYSNQLYQEWKRDRLNWPGMMVARGHVNQSVRKVFNGATYDPKVDQDYDEDAWESAFYSIKFDVEHGISSDITPSRCFLCALIYYHKRELTVKTGHFMPDPRKSIINWIELERIVNEKADEKCTFPEEKDQQRRYEDALRAASAQLFSLTSPLFMDDAQMIQLVIQGDEKMNRVTENISKLTI